MRKDESYGVIPLRKSKGEWQVFLIQHNKSGYWGFPKGHAEGGESPMKAAFRELKEETNLEMVKLLYEKPLIERYTFTADRIKVAKTVQYFIAEVEGAIMLQRDEIYDGVWLSLPQAIKKVTHEEGKSLLAQVELFFYKEKPDVFS